MYENNVVYIDSDLEDLIPGYLGNRQKDIELIKQLLDERKLSEIQRIGHSMKGSGGGYGFDEISRIGNGIEEAAKQGDQNKIEQLINQLAQFLATVEIVCQDEDGF
jgi:HPt (histidine-containing phosphotransfer) domain-containing protein